MINKKNLKKIGVLCSLLVFGLPYKAFSLSNNIEVTTNIMPAITISYSNNTLDFTKSNIVYNKVIVQSNCTYNLIQHCNKQFKDIDIYSNNNFVGSINYINTLSYNQPNTSYKTYNIKYKLKNNNLKEKLYLNYLISID